MLIVCMTLSAAADVLSILLGARLLPGSTFHVTSPMPPDTSYHFTFSALPPPTWLNKYGPSPIPPLWRRTPPIHPARHFHRGGGATRRRLLMVK